MPPSGDPIWTDDLMGAHNFVINDCQACHGSSGFGEVLLDQSASTTFPNSCIGCHGRLEDERDGALPGAGLRAHHTNTGVFDCITGCHGAESGFMPVGENVLPDNYDLLGIDPCNPGPVFSENLLANSGGIDFGGLNNDGDVDDLGPIYDTDDLDCGPVVSPTPSPTATPTPTGVPSPTPTATPTATATATPTPTGVPSPTPTATPTATATATPTATPAVTAILVVSPPGGLPAGSDV
jgi:hypothetical protein